MASGRDRTAANTAWRRWYRANAARKIEWQQRRRRELRRWWAELKATRACEHCGELAPECLHFHHVDPSEKRITLSDAITNGWSRPRILDEVARCIVLCANCHAKRHWDDRLLK